MSNIPLPVTSVNVRGREIWWLVSLIYFISLLIITETSVVSGFCHDVNDIALCCVKSQKREHLKDTSDSRNTTDTKLHTRCLCLSLSLDWTTMQEIVSHRTSEQQRTQVGDETKTKYRSSGSKYLRHVRCLPSRYSRYLIVWSCSGFSLAFVGT